MCCSCTRCPTCGQPTPHQQFVPVYVPVYPAMPWYVQPSPTVVPQPAILPQIWCGQQEAAPSIPYGSGTVTVNSGHVTAAFTATFGQLQVQS